MKIRGHVIIVSILMVLFQLMLISVGKAGSTRAMCLQPNEYQDRLLMKTIEYTYRDSFTAAQTALDSILIITPDYWPAYVFKVGVLYGELSDDENDRQLDRFYSLIDTAGYGLDNYIAENPEDKWAYYFKGVTMGYRALYEGQNGSWLKAVIKGLEAGKQYSKAIELDSTFYEAYLGLGNLNYWRSAKMGLIRSLPFISDKREEGIYQVQLARDSSRYSSLPAATSLAMIYLDKKDYKKSLDILNNLMSKGYRGRQVLWPKGMAAFKIGHSEGVIASFKSIKKGLERKGNQNYYNIGLCNYYLGIAYYWRGEYIDALKHFNALLDQTVEKDISNRLKKKYDRAEDYKEKIKDKVARQIEEKRSSD